MKENLKATGALAPPESENPQSAVTNLLERTQRGEIRQSINNCVLILQNDPALKGVVQKNLLTGRIDITRPVWWTRSGTCLTDTDMNYIKLYLEKTYEQRNHKAIEIALSVAANECAYHPVRDYLSALRWDGTSRMRHALHHFLGAPEDDLTEQSLRLFLLGAVSRVFEPGCKFEYMLCLVGGQGAGKSTFFRFLAIRDEWFTDDVKHLDDNRVYQRLGGHFIVEMSEMLATANAKSVEEIKSFLSRQKDNYRTPYDKYPEDRPRQCVFGGTTNQQKFLPFDRTGSRRFVPVQVNPHQAEVHILEDEAASRAYIDQLWAEVMVVYRKGGFELKFSDETEAQLMEHRLAFMGEDTLAGQVQAWLDDYRGDYVCTLQIYQEALGHVGETPRRWETTEINDIMNLTIRGWKQTGQHRFIKYGQQRSWTRVQPEKPKQEEFTDVTGSPDIPIFNAEQLSIDGY
ncbi:MAG: hypothetical protein IKN60_00200 [Bacteroidales bacterium]|nr:hypothetical protein [Bacteroidales bacterium]